MESTIHISGIPKFDESILGLREKVNSASRRIVERGGVMIASDAKKQFRTRPSGSQRTSKTGKLYFSFKPPYQATPPRPTNRTGNLSRSIKIQAVTPIEGGWMSATGPSMMYAPFVEYGTSRMKPEPFMSTSVHRLTSELSTLATEIWAEAVV